MNTCTDNGAAAANNLSVLATMILSRQLDGERSIVADLRKRPAIVHRIERLEQKRSGGLRVVYQRDVEQSLIDKPLADEGVAMMIGESVKDI